MWGDIGKVSAEVYRNMSFWGPFHKHSLRTILP